MMSKVFPLVKLSAQVALLGYVPWNLRGVFLSVRENIVDIRFFFHDEITQKERDIVETVLTTIRSGNLDEGGKKIEFTYDVQRCDFPARPPTLDDEWCIYFRYEGDM